VSEAGDPVVTLGGRLRVCLRGAGPRLLLVHGLTASGAVWDRVSERLEGRFTLVIPDLLGRGTSDAAPRARFRLAEEVGRLEDVARAHVPGPFVLVGHSQGAALALALAARTTRCRGLCLVDPVTPWTKRPLVLELLRSGPVRASLAPLLSCVRWPLTRLVLRRRVFGDPDAVDEAVVRRYAAPYRDRDRARTLLRVLADWRPGEISPHLAPRPTALVLTGERDRRAPPHLVERLADRLECPLRVVPGAGHALPEEAPDAVARAIEAVADGRWYA